MDLTNNEIDILKDMVDEWSDKDRHGELESDWHYDHELTDAVSSLHGKVMAIAKERGFWWAK